MPTVIIAQLKQKNDADFKLVHIDDIEGVGHALVFAFPLESLSAAVFMPRPSFRLLSKFARPTATGDQRFTVTAGTAGSSTNTIVLESTATNPFTGSPSWTIQATLALAALKLKTVSAFTSSWLWNPATEYLRVRCSDVGTAPKDVVAYFEWDYETNP